jgi:hypothetical protein
MRGPDRSILKRSFYFIDIMVPLWHHYFVAPNAITHHGERIMDNGDTREFTVTIMDGNDEEDYKRGTHWRRGEEDLVEFIRECCERYGMKNSDPDPDEPFTLIIKRIPKSGKLDIERLTLNAIFGHG